MKGKTWITVLVLLLMTALAAGCGSGKEESSGGGGENVIKVATVTPLSGSQAALGEAIKLGAQLAVDEQKAEFEKLGFKLELTPQDDQADPKVGVATAQKLVADKDVLGVCGHWNSGVAIPSSEVYVKDNLVMVSPANTAVQVTERGLPTVNRIVSRDDVQGPVGADFATQELGAKSIFVVHDKTTYGQGVADEFKARAESNGAQIAGYEGITSGETDFSAVVNSIVMKKPDVVYFGGIYPEGSLLVKQMREKGVKAEYIGPDGIDSSEVINIAGDAAVGVYYTSMAADVRRTEEGQKWAENYKKVFGKEIESYSAYGYDAMNVLLEGIKKAIADNGGKKPDRKKISEVIRATQGYKGLVTSVTFDGKGDNKDSNVYVYQFKEKKYPASLIKEMSSGHYLK